jgi:hypothetical protein
MAAILLTFMPPITSDFNKRALLLSGSKRESIRLSKRTMQVEPVSANKTIYRPTRLTHVPVEIQV